tara:strand:+ start:1961 stop:2275 length:315 start_codon:yes stop_codon:yes gene_type:complete
MIIVDPTNAEQVIKVIPRFFPEGEVTMRIEDSFSGTDEVVSAIYVKGTDDKLKILFTYSFKEHYTYKISLTDSEDGIAFRGMLFATKAFLNHTMTPFNYTSWKQ